MYDRYGAFGHLSGTLVGWIRAVVFLAMVIHSNSLGQSNCPPSEELIPGEVPITGDFLGYSVGLSSDWLALGVLGDDTLSSDAGAVVLFRRQGTDWVETAKLTASDGDSGDSFGRTLSLNDDTVLIGAPYDELGGSCYVFRFDGASWIQEAKLNSAGGSFDNFGDNVFISGDLAIIQAVDLSTFTPNVFFYRLVGTTWALEHGPFSIGGPYSALNTYNIAAEDDDSVMLGVPDDDTAFDGGGAVYNYNRTPDGEWGGAITIVPNDLAPGDAFGTSVAIFGGDLLVGAPGDDEFGGNVGSVYVFRLDGFNWVIKDKLPPPTYPGTVGNALVMDGIIAILGDPSLNMGYVFRSQAGVWTYSATLQPEAEAQYFGWSLGTDDGYAVVGAPYSDHFGTDAGAAYLFAVSAEDCNGNGVADVCDTHDGVSSDCDSNLQPDECQLDQGFVAASGELSLVGFGSPQSFTIPEPPDAGSEVTLLITATADLGSPTEWLEVEVNGTSVGNVFAEGESDDCPVIPLTEEILVSSDAWNTAVAMTDAVVTVVGSVDVDPYLCEASVVTIDIEYQKADADCNRNGVLDSCDLLSGASVDCDGDGTADDCQIEPRFLAVSGLLSPIGHAAPQEYMLAAVPESIDDVMLDFQAIADLASSLEWIDIDIDGMPLGSIFVSGPPDDCPATAERDALTVSSELFNNAIDDGEAIIHLIPTVEVDEALYESSYIVVTIDYPIASELEDCNENDVLDRCEADCNGNIRPDECDLIEGTSLDCNGNLVPDECDIASGVSSDCDGNAVPDECQPDCNVNGMADPCDIGSGASQDCGPNGIPDECEADCNSNGAADGCDIAFGESKDCDASGVPDECEPTVCPGDANQDCMVDPLDSGFVAARFGCIYPQDGEFCLAADVNGDGSVDPLDAGFVQARFGGCP